MPISLYVKSPFILVANPEPAGQDRAGVHQARQGSQAAAQLRVGRRGRAPAPVDGVRQAAVRLRRDPRAVSRSTGQSVTDLAAGHVDDRLRRSRRLDPADQGRQAARARGVGRRSGCRCCRTCRRSRKRPSAPDFEAVSWHILLAPAKTPKDDRRPAARRDEEDHGATRR